MTRLRHDARTSLGALLAVIAVFGLVALSGWHNIVIHDDDAIHVTSIEHRHGASKQADPDAPIHMLAHAVGQWISTTGSSAALAEAVIAAHGWFAFEVCLRGGIGPDALLRPPRG